MTQHTFTKDSRNLKVDVRTEPSKTKYARAYVWTDDRKDPVWNTDSLRMLAEVIGASSIYANRGEFPLLDNAWDMLNKKDVESKRSDLDAALAAAVDAGLLSNAPSKIKFSGKAGCSCGCSPGFILEGVSGSKTVYVDNAVAA